jgi:14-3-3 protein epsilon
LSWSTASSCRPPRTRRRKSTRSSRATTTAIRSSSRRTRTARRAPSASYEAAIAVATDKLGKPDPAYLGLALNYSVLLYEIIGKKQEAIDLADKSYKAAVDLLDSLNDADYAEATLIMQLLKDNLALWNEERGG